MNVCINNGATFAGCKSTLIQTAGGWSVVLAPEVQVLPGAHGSANVADADGDRTTAEIDLAPDTIIDTATGAYGGDGSQFAFHSPTTGAAFQCQVDSGPFVQCTSPYTAYAATGPHVFRVRAQTSTRRSDAGGAAVQCERPEARPDDASGRRRVVDRRVRLAR